MEKQIRKVQLTINNPQEFHFDHETIKKSLLPFNPSYFCIADEIATTGTPHTHVFMYSPSAFRFSTVKTRFPVAHIEKCKGSCIQNRNYIKKEGIWADDPKSDTSVPGSFEEYGTIPSEDAEKAPAMSELLDDIENEKTTAEIIKQNPKFAFKAKEIDTLRETLTSDKNADTLREIKVIYLYGPPGVGKTFGIYQRHNPRDICRITSYRDGRNAIFDGYHGQKILVFEEFHSQIPLSDFLSYLDKYPLMLPARYSDRTACYDTVYIVSNSPLEMQYVDVQCKSPLTWKALLRRISEVWEYLPDGNINIHPKEDRK